MPSWASLRWSDSSSAVGSMRWSAVSQRSVVVGARTSTPGAAAAVPSALPSIAATPLYRDGQDSPRQGSQSARRGSCQGWTAEGWTRIPSGSDPYALNRQAANKPVGSDRTHVEVGVSVVDVAASSALRHGDSGGRSQQSDETHQEGLRRGLIGQLPGVSTSEADRLCTEVASTGHTSATCSATCSTSAACSTGEKSAALGDESRHTCRATNTGGRESMHTGGRESRHTAFCSHLSRAESAEVDAKIHRLMDKLAIPEDKAMSLVQVCCSRGRPKRPPPRLVLLAIPAWTRTA